MMVKLTSAGQALCPRPVLSSRKQVISLRPHTILFVSVVIPFRKVNWHQKPGYCLQNSNTLQTALVADKQGRGWTSEGEKAPMPDA